MKTYIITEKDLERLQEIYNNDGDSWWHNGRMDEWEETLNELPTHKKLDLSFKTPEDFYTNRTKYFVNIALDEDRTEFSKFIEENNFIKPEQPYYVRDGEIFDYGDLRELFLENRNSTRKK